MRAFSFLSALCKDAPAAGDVHVSTALGGRKKAKPFKAIIGEISQDTKLPVTGADLAAQQENSDNDASMQKRGARHSSGDRAALQAIHDNVCALGAVCDGQDDDGESFFDDAVSQLDGFGKWSLPVKITKLDEDKCLVFGWASVIEKDGAVVLDRQGDMISPQDLEGAVYEYVLEKRHAGEMHERTTGVGKMVESLVMTAEKQQAMGLPQGSTPIGWWVGYKLAPSVFAKVKSGEYPMFSIGGGGIRVPAI